MGDVVSFRSPPEPRRPSRDTIVIAPVPDGGGCWGIFRADRFGESRVTTRFNFADAAVEARRIARETGAFYDDGAGDAA